MSTEWDRIERLLKVVDFNRLWKVGIYGGVSF